MRSGGAGGLSRVLGVDIGATSTRVRLVANGVVVGDATAASASLTAVGRERAAAVLDGLLTGLPGPDGPLDAVCAGAAGSRTGRDTGDFLRARLAPITRYGDVLVVDDASLVLPAAGLAEGVAVICGRRARRKSSVSRPVRAPAAPAQTASSGPSGPGSPVSSSSRTAAARSRPTAVRLALAAVASPTTTPPATSRTRVLVAPMSTPSTRLNPPAPPLLMIRQPQSVTIKPARLNVTVCLLTATDNIVKNFRHLVLFRQ